MEQKQSIAGLRQKMAALEHNRKHGIAPLGFGAVEIDTAINGGLAAGRMHEVNGLAAWSLVVALAGRAGGPVLWCAAGNGSQANRYGHRLYPPGCVALGLQPRHVLVVECRTQVDASWACEEALRSGAARMVIMEIAGAIDLTAARRLQLAAEAGGGFGLVAGMGRNPAFPAATSRWRAEPACNGRMFLQLTRNRTGTGGQWMVEWNEAAHHLSVVSSPRRRAGNAAAAHSP